MDLITEQQCNMHSVFREIRKRNVPEPTRQALLEHFMESSDVIAIMAEARITKPIDSGILGAMAMAFMAGCMFAQVQIQTEAEL